MRKSVVIVVLVMLAALGTFVPSVAAAASGPKVAIIVGPVEGKTSEYRSDADVAYAEARRYTANVVKVYSPNATWSAVRSATSGASIVVYFGHGNGWPSPYTYDPAYRTKDGFGLNAAAGHGDSNNTYYGEPSVATLDLAPNAVVILGRLCYASGNSEPGNADPSQAVARQRVDNFGAGFLKVARAVIADGHGNPAPYIRALFTTHATIEEVWRGAPNFRGHVASFPSTRTSGATAYTDTDGATTGYYRSLVAKPGLTTDAVTGAAYADTSKDPTSLVVPGNATVAAAGAPLLDAEGQPVGTAPAGARLRVIATEASIAAAGPTYVQVQGVDDPSISGWMVTTDLVPRDGTAPQVWAVDTAAGVVSPNDDGRSDTVGLTGRFSESSSWRVRVQDGGAVLREWTGTGTEFAVSWDGTSGGSAVADGTYTVAIRATDAWGNGPTDSTTTVRVDTVASDLDALTPADAVVGWITPDGDGSRETASWTATPGEAGSLVTEVYDNHDGLVRTLTTATSGGATAISWDGRTTAGARSPDGAYEVRITPYDLAGNPGTTLVRPARVSTTLGFVRASSTFFFPQDGDAFAKSTTLSYRLARPATVTWVIRDASGTIVDTLADGVATAAGTHSRTYTGRLANGAWLPAGAYTAAVFATDGLATTGQAVSFRMDAFKIVVSDTTPARGQSITVTATSAEPLSTALARLYITQPGYATWSVPMPRSSTSVSKVTVKLKAGGTAGNVTFKVLARDRNGQAQRSSVVYTSH